MNRAASRFLALAATIATGTCSAGGWTYDSQTDPMTSKTGQVAQIESINSLDLQFPYRGLNRGTVVVRAHPRYGFDVFVMVDKGQIVCHSARPCAMSVRFDNAPPMRFTAVRANDGRSTAVFLRPAEKFVAEARKSHAILVQLTMYQAGEQLLKFASDKPLEWTLVPKPRTAKTPASPPVGCEAATAASDGACGQQHALCTLEAAGMVGPAHRVFMGECLRHGVAAARGELASQKAAGTLAADTQWPTPPASLSGSVESSK